MRKVANFLLLTIGVTIVAYIVTKTLGSLGVVPDSADYRIGLATGLAPFIILLNARVNLLKHKEN